jgi:hypothetical protein
MNADVRVSNWKECSKGPAKHQHIPRGIGRRLAYDLFASSELERFIFFFTGLENISEAYHNCSSPVLASSTKLVTSTAITGCFLSSSTYS